MRILSIIAVKSLVVIAVFHLITVQVNHFLTSQTYTDFSRDQLLQLIELHQPNPYKGKSKHKLNSLIERLIK